MTGLAQTQKSLVFSALKTKVAVGGHLGKASHAIAQVSTCRRQHAEAKCYHSACRVRHGSNIARSSESYQAVEPVVLALPASDAELNESCHHISDQIRTWLNEEWTDLDVHKDLGCAAAQAYKKTRADGENEVGGVLLGISSELMTFDFRETFVNAFEVANKVAEIVMTLDGKEVCCQSDDAKARIDRVAADVETD